MPKKESYKHLLKGILIAIVVAFVMRSFLYDGYRIASNSMAPTLVQGDFLLASKASYGYGPFSFPGAQWIVPRKMWRDPPARGDVIIFRYSLTSHQDCVKRVMGIAGDTVQIKQGIVYINDFPCPLEKVETYSNGLILYRETLPSGRQHFVLKKGELGHAAQDDMPLLLIPPATCFVMGDNRDDSQDSRDQMRMGFVRYETLVGRADAFFSTGRLYNRLF